MKNSASRGIGKNYQPGDLLFDRFTFEDIIAEGNEGKILLVRNGLLERLAALRIIGAGVSLHDDARQLLQRAARLTAKVQHENIIRIDDADFRNDPPWILMEYVPGDSLRSRLKAAGAAPVSWVGHILEQLCSALAAIHKAGIVLRDIEPSRLMLTKEDHLKLMVFGLARWLDPGKGSLGVHTRSGEFLGSCQYSSPEWISGGTLNERSDIYSIGVILYEMLSGRLPFAGDFDRVTKGHCGELPPSFSKAAPEVAIPQAVEEVVLRCLAKNPLDRFQSADALSGAFLAAMPPHLLVAAPPPAQAAAIEATPCSIELSTAPSSSISVPLSDQGPRSEESPVPDQPGLHVAFRRGVAVARVTGRAWDDLAEKLDDLIACNDRLVLDVSSVMPISVLQIKLLNHCHSKMVTAGGLLKIVGIAREQAGVWVVARDEESALAGDWPIREQPVSRPPPVAAKRIRGARRRRGRRASLSEDLITDWLERSEPSENSPTPIQDKPTPGPSLDVALSNPALNFFIRLDVLVVEPRSIIGRDADAAVTPLCQVIAAMRARPDSRNVVIDMWKIVSLSEAALTDLTRQAAHLVRASGALRLCRVQPGLQESINQSPLARLIEVYPTVDDAVITRWRNRPRTNKDC